MNIRNYSDTVIRRSNAIRLQNETGMAAIDITDEARFASLGLDGDNHLFDQKISNAVATMEQQVQSAAVNIEDEESKTMTKSILQSSAAEGRGQLKTAQDAAGTFLDSAVARFVL